MDKQKQVPPEVQRQLETVMELNNIDPSDYDELFWEELFLKEKPGIIGMMMIRDNGYVFANMPVLIVPEESRLNAWEVLRLTATIKVVKGANFAVAEPGGILYFMFCTVADRPAENDIKPLLENMLEIVTFTRQQVRSALERVQGLADTGPASTRPEPRLPNIKMTPKEAGVIYKIFRQSDKRVEDIYHYLVTAWARAGFIVTTTASTIVLDVPRRDRSLARLAMLFPSTIVLFWDNLRKAGDFPIEAIDTYQKRVKRIAEMHITRSAAHIRMGEDFDLRSARKLFKAMSDLAGAIKPYKEKSAVKFRKMTPENLKATLETCNSHSRTVLEHLIEKWSKAKGSVQCRRPGRIYLKMKTRAHQSGCFARVPRHFNLCTLTTFKDQETTYVELSWNLATSECIAYLDCVPEAVSHFQDTVTVLPGFEQINNLRRLVIDKNFQVRHADTLLQAMLALKAAESEAA